MLIQSDFLFGTFTFLNKQFIVIGDTALPWLVESSSVFILWNVYSRIFGQFTALN